MEYQRVHREARPESRVSSTLPRTTSFAPAVAVGVRHSLATLSQLRDGVNGRDGVHALQRVAAPTNVIQRAGALDTLKTALSDGLSTLWGWIRAGHQNKANPLLLNSLAVMTAAIRFARSDNSIGAAFGTGLIATLAGLESAWSAYEDWQAATGEGKELWDKRANVIQKMTAAALLVASLIASIANPLIGGAIAGIGMASIGVARSAYDFAAGKIWGTPAAAGGANAPSSGGSGYGSLPAGNIV